MAAQSKGYDSNPFEADTVPSMESVSNALYGTGEKPPQDRIIAQALPLEQVQPDPAQPRRAIPLMFGGSLKGWVAGVETWQAGQRRTYNWRELVRGMGEGVDSEGMPRVVADFYELCGLAASINSDGLANPITVWRKADNQYLIETGERRFMAHWLLSIGVDKKRYGRIAARVVDKPDVWRQAAENGARKPLNAIGMARQLALLVMEMYRADAANQFYDYDWFEGQGDRGFYAQVANGNLWRIKKGMGQRIMDVTGLKSVEQVAQYRRLLNIPDDLWMKADVENWTENRIREHVQVVPDTRDTLTGVKVSPTFAPALPRTDMSAITDISPEKAAPVQRHTITTVMVSDDGEGETAWAMSDKPDYDGRERWPVERVGSSEVAGKPLTAVATYATAPEAHADQAEAAVSREPYVPPVPVEGAGVIDKTTLNPVYNRLSLTTRDVLRVLYGGRPVVGSLVFGKYRRPITTEWAMELYESVSEALELAMLELHQVLQDEIDQAGRNGE